jgi:hypothetical protein
MFLFGLSYKKISIRIGFGTQRNPHHLCEKLTSFRRG